MQMVLQKKSLHKCTSISAPVRYYKVSEWSSELFCFVINRVCLLKEQAEKIVDEINAGGGCSRCSPHLNDLQWARYVRSVK